MKIPILTTNNTEVGKKDLPQRFAQAVRPDVVKRAVLAIRGNSRQSYGSDVRAGMKHATELSRRRHDYKSSYGHGISRVPRKTLNHRGARFFWVGAQMPGTVGGRRAHPPKVEKVWAQKINKKEKQLALQSALSATMIKEAVAANGHKVPAQYPFIIETKFEELTKTKDVLAALEKLGFKEELTRSAVKRKARGKGKARGRRTKKARGPLVVVSGTCKVQKAARNIPGIEVVHVNELNTALLTHDIKPGRLTLFTDAAIDAMGKSLTTKKEKQLTTNPLRGTK
jgi:large subunit ribosomal protein L4e